MELTYSLFWLSKSSLEDEWPGLHRIYQMLLVVWPWDMGHETPPWYEEEELWWGCKNSSSSFIQNIDMIIQKHTYICVYTMFEGTNKKALTRYVGNLLKSWNVYKLKNIATIYWTSWSFDIYWKRTGQWTVVEDQMQLAGKATWQDSVYVDLRLMGINPW